MVERFESMVRFQCPQCANVADVSVELIEPDWYQEDYGSEPFRGIATVVCRRCEAFPAHFEFKGFTLESITLDDFPKTTISISQPGYFDGEDYDFLNDYPQDPFRIFKETHGQTLKLLAEQGEDSGDALVNRMVFAHQVTAMEAYLGDTIRKALDWHETALLDFVTNSLDFSGQKYLPQVLTNRDFVAGKAKKYLDSVLYHRLAKVENIYATALNITILPDEPVKDKLIEAIKLRHDCVHRNGFDMKGNKLKIFTREYVQDLADTILRLVSRIEGLIVWKQYYDSSTLPPPATAADASP